MNFELRPGRQSRETEDCLIFVEFGGCLDCASMQSGKKFHAGGQPFRGPRDFLDQLLGSVYILDGLRNDPFVKAEPNQLQMAYRMLESGAHGKVLVLPNV
jgi:hypothetical protein